MEADKLFIADSLVWFHDARWTLDPPAITVTISPAAVVIPTPVTHIVAAVPVAAGTLTGAALGHGSPQGAGKLPQTVLGSLRPAARLETVLLPATVALLPVLHDSIAADGHLRL